MVLGFKQHIAENLEKFTKLKHLEHAEDLPIDSGAHGYHHATETLNNVHKRLTGVFNDTKITTKYDGSPSVVFGHNPENGKFFVASKSAFNKDPKLNYTLKDIEKNHGHAPGLVEKLKAALEHLPKVSPKHGVYQGDVMHTPGDVHETKEHYNFTPNTIMYSVPKKSEEGQKIAKSKFGVVIHTKYHGKNLEAMNAGFDPDLHNFKNHPHVHVINHEFDPDNVMHSGKNQTAFTHHMKQAEREHNRMNPEAYSNISHHALHIKTYINHTVREGSRPTIEGYRLSLLNKGKKEMESVKTAASKQKRFGEMEANLKHVEANAGHFETLFKMHHHIQKAKDALVDTLSHGVPYEHSIGGKEAKPEGFVAIHHGHPVKLVNRAEFSRANFEKNKRT